MNISGSIMPAATQLYLDNNCLIQALNNVEVLLKVDTQGEMLEETYAKIAGYVIEKKVFEKFKACCSEKHLSQDPFFEAYVKDRFVKDGIICTYVLDYISNSGIIADLKNMFSKGRDDVLFQKGFNLLLNGYFPDLSLTVAQMSCSPRRDQLLYNMIQLSLKNGFSNPAIEALKFEFFDKSMKNDRANYIFEVLLVKNLEDAMKVVPYMSNLDFLPEKIRGYLRSVNDLNDDDIKKAERLLPFCPEMECILKALTCVKTDPKAAEEWAAKASEKDKSIILLQVLKAYVGAKSSQDALRILPLITESPEITYAANLLKNYFENANDIAGIHQVYSIACQNPSEFMWPQFIYRLIGTDPDTAFRLALSFPCPSPKNLDQILLTIAEELLRNISLIIGDENLKLSRLSLLLEILTKVKDTDQTAKDFYILEAFRKSVPTQKKLAAEFYELLSNKELIKRPILMLIDSLRYGDAIYASETFCREMNREVYARCHIGRDDLDSAEDFALRLQDPVKSEILGEILTRYLFKGLEAQAKRIFTHITDDPVRQIAQHRLDRNSVFSNPWQRPARLTDQPDDVRRSNLGGVFERNYPLDESKRFTPIQNWTPSPQIDAGTLVSQVKEGKYDEVAQIIQNITPSHLSKFIDLLFKECKTTQIASLMERIFLSEPHDEIANRLFQIHISEGDIPSARTVAEMMRDDTNKAIALSLCPIAVRPKSPDQPLPEKNKLDELLETKNIRGAVALAQTSTMKNAAMEYIFTWLMDKSREDIAGEIARDMEEPSRSSCFKILAIYYLDRTKGSLALRSIMEIKNEDILSDAWERYFAHYHYKGGVEEIKEAFGRIKNEVLLAKLVKKYKPTQVEEKKKIVIGSQYTNEKFPYCSIRDLCQKEDYIEALKLAKSDQSALQFFVKILLEGNLADVLENLTFDMDNIQKNYVFKELAFYFFEKDKKEAHRIAHEIDFPVLADEVWAHFYKGYTSQGNTVEADKVFAFISKDLRMKLYPEKVAIRKVPSVEEIPTPLELKQQRLGSEDFEMMDDHDEMVTKIALKKSRYLDEEDEEFQKALEMSINK